jgi:TctA family transporter
MLMSQGEMNVFWSNPLVGTIMALAVVILVWPVLGALFEKTRRRKMVSAHEGAAE